MVSVLVSGASGLGSSPSRRHCVVFLGKTLYSHKDSSRQMYKLVIASHPGGCRNTPGRFVLVKPGYRKMFGLHSVRALFSV